MRVHPLGVSCGRIEAVQHGCFSFRTVHVVFVPAAGFTEEAGLVSLPAVFSAFAGDSVISGHFSLPFAVV